MHKTTTPLSPSMSKAKALKLSSKKSRGPSIVKKFGKKSTDLGFSRCSEKLPPIIEQTCQYLEQRGKYFGKKQSQMSVNL